LDANPAAKPRMTSESKETKLELRYFDMRGRAEQIRLLLAYAKVPYTDTGLARSQWGKHKDKMPLGQVPVLYETTGSTTKSIPQSMSIMRHLARVYNLYGKTEDERVDADILADTVLDWRILDYNKVIYAPNFCSDKSKVTELFKERVPTFLKGLEKLHKGKIFFNGDVPLYSDFMAFDALDSMCCVQPDVLNNYPKWTAFLDAMRNLDGVKEYLAKRRKSEIDEFMGR
jgi:glutathione S-transferase